MNLDNTGIELGSHSQPNEKSNRTKGNTKRNQNHCGIDVKWKNAHVACAQKRARGKRTRKQRARFERAFFSRVRAISARARFFARARFLRARVLCMCARTFLRACFFLRACRNARAQKRACRKSACTKTRSARILRTRVFASTHFCARKMGTGNKT